MSRSRYLQQQLHVSHREDRILKQITRSKMQQTKQATADESVLLMDGPII